MKKITKVLLIALFSIIALFIIVVGIVWLKRDSIKQYAVTQLNEQLTATISVQSIGITFISQFPMVSLQFNNVSIADPIRPKQYLLKANRVFMAFNLMNILTQQYNIKLIEIDSGECNLFIDTQKRKNYIITKPSASSSDDILLSLKKINLHNVVIKYTDLSAMQQYEALAQQVNISGDFKGKRETLSATGNLYVQKIKSDAVTYLKEKQFTIDIATQIDETTNTFKVSKGKIVLGNLVFECSGSVQSLAQKTNLNLAFVANKMSINSLLELLPGSINKTVSQYKSSGNIYFNGKIKGEVSAKKQPNINIQFGIEKGTLQAEKNISITNLICKGEFSNGVSQQAKSSYIIIPSFAFKLGNGQFNGALNISNFTNPNIDIALNGNTNIQDLLDFTQSQWIDKAEGNLSFDIAVKGNIKEMKTKQGFLNIQTRGNIKCDAKNIEFKNGAKNIESIETEFTLNKQNLEIKTFKAKVENSDIEISGILENIVPYMLINNQILVANISYKSDFINLEHLILPIPQDKTNNIHTSPFTLPSSIIVNASVSIGKLQYHQFEAAKVLATINWKGKKIETQNLQCQTMKGGLAIKGTIENAADGRFLIASTIDCKQLDLTELFRQTANLGQSEITYQNIKGNLSSTIDLVGVWSATMDCDLDKLYALGKLHITNGQLLNYKPLEELSKYISISDLQNLKFADLSNTIEIRNKTIYIPTMEVQNNALNLSVSGTHTFSNFLDYHFKIRLGELLAKKYKTKRNEFEEENLAEGNYLFLSMKGPIDNLKFSYDKKQARQKIKEDLKKEKETVKDIWRKELGLDKDKNIHEKSSDNDELEFEAE